MLVEKKLNDALKDYIKGRKVIALQCQEDGKIDANLLSDFLENEQNKYLVDVPAYRNPDFEAAVRDMEEATGNPEEQEQGEQSPPAKSRKR